MAKATEIVSASNKKIKELSALMQKGRVRAEAGCFVAEGEHLWLEAPPERVRSICIARSARERYEDRSLQAGVPVYILEDRLFEKVSDTKSPQGVLCVVAMSKVDEEALLAGSNPLFLLLERLRDPGNLGTIMRAAEAAGVDGIFLSGGCADPYQPKVVRSAMGALYRMPLIPCGDMKLTMAKLKERSVRIYGSSLAASGAYDAFDYRRGSAFVIGNESRGISPEILELCDETIIIPMKGRIESLNAAVAAALLVFEAARQRRG